MGINNFIAGGCDYNDERLNVLFAAGQRTAEIEVNITDDGEHEGNEMFRLRITDVDERLKGRPGSEAEVHIIDNEECK